MKQKGLRRRAWGIMYDRGWNRSALDDSLRSRLCHALSDWHHWYDWGHPVMWLVGRNDSGSSGIPRGRDMWWVPADHVEGIYASWLADVEQRNGCYVTTSYSVVKDAPVGWNIFDLQDDGHTIVIGRWPSSEEDGGHIQKIVGGMNRQQVRLFLRWYLWDHKAKAQWFGLRHWIYFKALHAAVNQKVPFACQRTPDKGAGGYSHWHCQRRKFHKGAHRFVNYTWAGPGARVQHDPAEAAL